MAICRRYSPGVHESKQAKIGSWLNLFIRIIIDVGRILLEVFELLSESSELLIRQPPILQLARSTPSIPDTIRSVSDCLLISNENKATFCACLSATYLTLVKAQLAR